MEETKEKSPEELRREEEEEKRRIEEFANMLVSGGRTNAIGFPFRIPGVIRKAEIGDYTFYMRFKRNPTVAEWKRVIDQLQTELIKAKNEQQKLGGSDVGNISESLEPGSSGDKGSVL